MKHFIVKIECVQGGGDKTVPYPEDRTLALQNQMGEKLLLPPITLNVAPGEDVARVMRDLSRQIQKGRNLSIKLTISWERDMIRSPWQLLTAVDKFLEHLSECSTVTMPQKSTKQHKQDRQIRVDLRELVGSISVHDNTRTIHVHIVLCPIHPVYGQNIRLANGHDVLACAYARQQTLRDFGLLGESEMLYFLRINKRGYPMVFLDRKVLEQRKSMQKEGVKQPVTHPYSKWGKDNPAVIFKAICAEYYPNGPIDNGTTEDNRQKLGLLLANNNTCLTTKENGLVLVSRRVPIQMSKVNTWLQNPWTKVEVEQMTGLSGHWTLGKPMAQQSSVQRPEELQRFVDSLYSSLARPAAKFALPWAEYRVKIQAFKQTEHRRMTREELTDLVEIYWKAMNSCNLTVGCPGRDQLRLANIAVQPSVEGEQMVTICRIPAQNLPKALELQPNLLLRRSRISLPQTEAEMDDFLCRAGFNGQRTDQLKPATDIFYDAVYTIRFCANERSHVRSALKAVAQQLARLLGAAGYQYQFALPYSPSLGARTVTVPEIACEPHRGVSIPVQNMILPAWQAIVAAERAETVAMIERFAQLSRLNSAKALAALAETSPARTMSGEYSAEVGQIFQAMIKAAPSTSSLKQISRDDDEIENLDEVNLPTTSSAPEYEPELESEGLSKNKKKQGRGNRQKQMEEATKQPVMQR